MVNSENLDIDRQHINDLNDQSFQLRHLDGARSMELARHAHELSRRSGYAAGIGKALLNSGFQELINAQYDKAFASFNQSLRIFRDANEREGIAHATYDLGLLYERLGDYENAMDVQQESLHIRKELHDADGIASCKSQIAYINGQFGLNDNALREYDECITIWRSNGNNAGLASALMALGNLKVKLNDLVAAKKHLMESLVIRKKLNEMMGILGSSNYLADVLLKEGNTLEAHALLSEALDTALKQPQPFAPGICRLRTNMAKAFVQLGDQDSAILHLEKALELAIETRQLYQLHDIYFELASLYKRSLQYDKALEYYEKFHTAKQNVINLNASTKLKNLEMMNKVELGEKEIEIHRLRNIELKQRNKVIRQERKRSDELLLNILPRQTANELKKNGVTKTRQYDLTTVLFTDFVNFTTTAEKLAPKELVDRIHRYFCAFDEILTEHNIEKIKTIGDAYMAAGGVPIANASNPVDVVMAALKIITYVNAQNDPLFRIRVGVHTGPVIAGVVGNKKFAY
ncbi:MAG TPA: tetratricopeptide repeat protein, partial [Chryseolinea sp.]|nr:tetratricopeptide repeat protein [Chryseolinea sp.]